ncbi:MAG TPA: ribosomal protein S18-alanine N-acetyltransferase [Dehalococcoidia bacterium]
MKLATHSYYVRPMTLADIPQVMDIERESFPTMWPQTAYRRELQENRLARYLVAVEEGAEAPPPPPEGSLSRLISGVRRAISGEEEPEPTREHLVGFLGIWFMVEEAHVVTIAVRASHRQRGIGELLLIRALELAAERGEATVTLEVRISNEPAQRLYEKYGFQRVGIRPRYYSDNQEDAVIMTTGRLDSQAYRALFQQRLQEYAARYGYERLHPVR